MNCKHLSKSLNGKLRCKYFKRVIILDECRQCLKIEPRVNKGIKKRSAKQIKKEKNRYSIFVDNWERCIICNKKADDIHEVWGGSNRQRSMKYGLCVPLCRMCHENEKEIMKLRERLEKEFIEQYGEEKFIKIIGKRCNYE